MMMMQIFQEMTLCQSCYFHLLQAVQKNKWFLTAYTQKMDAASSQNEGNYLLTDMVSYSSRPES